MRKSSILAVKIFLEFGEQCAISKFFKFRVWDEMGLNKVTHYSLFRFLYVIIVFFCRCYSIPRVISIFFNEFLYFSKLLKFKGFCHNFNKNIVFSPQPASLQAALIKTFDKNSKFYKKSKKYPMLDSAVDKLKGKDKNNFKQCIVSHPVA